ncbi:MAG: FecR family protein, partial [Acidobacteriota bacterium]
EDALRALLDEAGARTPLPAQDLEAIREAARAEARERYGGRRARPRVAQWWMAAAAAVLLAAAGLLVLRRAPAPAAATSAASVERLTGEVRSSEGVGELAPLPGEAVGRSIPVGALLETGGSDGNAGSVALAMAGGASVRLDAGSRLRVASPTVIELERGGVYVDTGRTASDREHVAVRTAAGLFQSIGTQFEVRAEEGGALTRLKVREGRVRLERGAQSVLTDAGQELVVRGDGSLDRGETAADGPEWDWVLTSAPMPDIEGVKVRTFLEWLARERGWRVELADSATAALADSVVLHGSIAHLTPAQAPDVVLPSGGLGYRVSKGTLVVFVANGRKEPVRTPR